MPGVCLWPLAGTFATWPVLFALRRLAVPTSKRVLGLADTRFRFALRFGFRFGVAFAFDFAFATPPITCVPCWSCCPMTAGDQATHNKITSDQLVSCLNRESFFVMKTSPRHHTSNIHPK